MPQAEGLRTRAARLRRTGGSTRIRARAQEAQLEASHAVGMARVFENRGELGRAQEMLDLAKMRAPFHYLAYAGAGYMHLRRRDLRAALEEFIQARRLNPLDASWRSKAPASRSSSRTTPRRCATPSTRCCSARDGARRGAGGA